MNIKIMEKAINANNIHALMERYLPTMMPVIRQTAIGRRGEMNR
jgi:hypothetical protein